MPRRRANAQPAGGPDDNPLVDQPEPLVEPSGGDDQDALQQLLAGLDDPSGHEVCIFEKEQDGTRRMLTRAGVADFDPWSFAERYGGGDYEMRVREIDSKRWVRQRAFSVSRRVPRRDAAQPAPTPAPTDSRDMLALMMNLVQAQATQQTAILTALIGRPQAESPIKLGEVASLITAVGGGAKPANDVAGLVAAVKELHTLSGNINGAAAASDEIELVKAVAPVLGELMKPRAHPVHRPFVLSQGGAGGGALPPAPPIQPAPQPAAAPTPAMPAAAEQTTAHPTGPLNAAMDTIAAIVLRIGLDNQGVIDSSAVARIGHQTMDALDIDTLDALLATVPAGDLPREIVGSTPLMVREQMAQQAEALRTLEGWLRAQIEDHFNNDDAAAPTPQEAPSNADT